MPMRNRAYLNQHFFYECMHFEVWELILNYVRLFVLTRLYFLHDGMICPKESPKS